MPGVWDQHQDGLRLFERHGLPEAIRSDNGSPFASRQAVHGLSGLSAWWVTLGIDLERGRRQYQLFRVWVGFLS